MKEKEEVAKQLRRFMRKHHLPFLATDRSVLNLPAIGKSMTFQLVGLTEEGKRSYVLNMTERAATVRLLTGWDKFIL